MGEQGDGPRRPAKRGAKAHGDAGTISSCERPATYAPRTSPRARAVRRAGICRCALSCSSSRASRARVRRATGGARVSAALRRRAALYADACEQIIGPSHLIYHRSKSNPGLSSRLTWHDFAFVRMAPWIMVDYDVNPVYPDPPFWARPADEHPRRHPPTVTTPGAKAAEEAGA